jgi:hypothetical protein
VAVAGFEEEATSFLDSKRMSLVTGALDIWIYGSFECYLRGTEIGRRGGGGGQDARWIARIGEQMVSGLASFAEDLVALNSGS